MIGLGTVTDPYQYAERRFMLSRMCLEVLRSKGREVHIHTKSDLVTRDIPVIGDMRCTVGMTITNIDDRMTKMTEPGAPMPGARLDAMRRLVDSGIPCYALIAPVMNTLDGYEERLMEAIADTGVRVVYHDPLNMRNVDPDILNRRGVRSSPEVRLRLHEYGLSLGLEMHGEFRTELSDESLRPGGN